jgi:4-amino-4-deoxy-L-arabinose transferase-like glycosyltransferase
MRAAIERLVEAAERWQESNLARAEGSLLGASAMLVVLVLALHLGGMLWLPPLDRTEVIYAQTARQMLDSGSSAAPHFQAEPRYDKPLPVLWLQAASADVFGLRGEIAGYRIPSLLGTILAVLATFWGVRPLLGARVAFVGASLVATCLVVTVQATLAMPEALMLAATCAAMWSLARMYAAPEGEEPGFAFAMLFWIALGLGMLANVLTVPLIALLTVLALAIADRGRIGWLCRAAPPVGVVVMLAIASAWPLALWYGGTLEAAIAQWKAEGWHLLLGPQEMKWRVVPGLFVLFLLLGLFPAGLFLAPAVGVALREWASSRVVRFMLAWIVPYLLFLELFTRKTPLYMVQAMLPPLCVLFALWIVRGGAAREHERRAYRIGVYGWLALVVGLVVALWVLPFLLELAISPFAVVLGLAVLVLATVTVRAMLDGKRAAASLALVATAVAFNNLAIPVTFAGLRTVWVSSEIRAAVDGLRACGWTDVLLVGHTEPSAVFELGSMTTRLGDGAKAAELLRARGGLAVIAEAQADAFLTALPEPPPVALACVAAYDFIKSCSHRFSIYSAARENYAGCRMSQRFDCGSVLRRAVVGRLCR